ncbi:MAG: hypothetical protein ACLQJR_07785 [Stellaceae bacterium]
MQRSQGQALSRQGSIDFRQGERQDRPALPPRPFQRLEATAQRREATALAGLGHAMELTYLFLFCSNHASESNIGSLPARATGRPSTRAQWMREGELGWDPKGKGPPTLIDRAATLDAKDATGTRLRSGPFTPTKMRTPIPGA